MLTTIPKPIQTYFSGYPEPILLQLAALYEANKIGQYLVNKYPNCHDVVSEKALFERVNQYKQRYLKNAPNLSSVKYKKQQQLVANALGTHTFRIKQHGNKLKKSHEIAIAEQLKYAPEALLDVLIVHELAHFKEKDHNKAFYNLCTHMLRDYHQLELDLRLFVLECEIAHNPWQKK